MAKHTQSKRALKRIIEQLHTTIMAWAGDHPKRKRYPIGHVETLPPLYILMAHQGEGILLQRFFGSLYRRIGMDITPQDWLEFWDSTVNMGGFLLDLISRSGWLTVLSKGADLPTVNSKDAKQLYCILLAVLAERSPQQLDLAVDAYFLHLWKQRFPSETRAPKTTDISQLRHKLNHKLRKLRHLPCESRESFVQHEDYVDFRLLYRDGANQAWHELIHITRPRLKSARLAAYETLLSEGALEAALTRVRTGGIVFKKDKKRLVVVRMSDNTS